MTRIGLIGCGSIGSTITDAIAKGIIPGVDEIIAYDAVKEKCSELQEKYREILKCVDSVDEIIGYKPRLVVEAASQEAVRQYGEKILSNGIDLVVMSVGALLDDELKNKLIQTAVEKNTRIYVPTGAIAGLDAIRAAKIAGIRSVELITRKPPRALGLDNLDKPKTLFEGGARRAVKEYPKNVNVSAALSLAAGREAKVKVIADPNVERNTHEIIVDSEATRIHIIVENKPSPTNPKTSYLASLSAIELLRRILQDKGLIIGS